jgi:hypothetical protein
VAAVDPLRRALLTTLSVIACSTTSACCRDHPRDLYPQQPETECQTGVEVGMDIAAWDCINGERVVAWRTSSALMGCSDVKVERAACGTATAFERGMHAQDQTRCPLLKR